MEQSATAAAMPAANRKSAPSRLLAVTCVIGIFAGSSPTHAGDTWSGYASAPDYIRYALLENRDANQIPADLYELSAALPGSIVFQTKPAAKPKLATKPIASPAAKPVLQKASAPAMGRSGLKATIMFGSRGMPVSLTPVTKRWQRALGEISQDGKKRRGEFKSYRAILDQVQGERRGLQIPKVNYMVNRLLAYREDSRLWKAAEYWATPAESLSRRAGDCEDYAILKYALLRDLGVADKDMRIAVLRDTAARQYHAVLSVRHNGKWLVLDNRFSRVRFERDLPHYKALYTVNAQGQWAHGHEKKAPIRLAARLKAATQ